MNETEKLDVLKTLVEIEDDTQDSELTVYLNMAGKKIITQAYPYDFTQTQVPPQYDFLQCQIAAYFWNKRGAEGESYHSENGINRSYENADVPKSMLATITPCVGVVG